MEKLERAPQKFSRASRAPLPVVDASIIHVEPTPSSPKSCIRPCNDIRNSERKTACVFVCVCRWGGGGGGGGGSLCICPPSDRQATSPLPLEVSTECDAISRRVRACMRNDAIYSMTYCNWLNLILQHYESMYSKTAFYDYILVSLPSAFNIDSCLITIAFCAFS